MLDKLTFYSKGATHINETTQKYIETIIFNEYSLHSRLNNKSMPMEGVNKDVQDEEFVKYLESKNQVYLKILNVFMSIIVQLKIR